MENQPVQYLDSFMKDRVILRIEKHGNLYVLIDSRTKAVIYNRYKNAKIAFLIKKEALEA